MTWDTKIDAIQGKNHLLESNLQI